MRRPPIIQQDEFTSTGTVATRDVTATCVPNKGRVAATQSDELEALLTRIRGEYGEMPGLSLTLTQTARLWSVDLRARASLLEALVGQGVLRRTIRGCYVLARRCLSVQPKTGVRNAATEGDVEATVAGFSGTVRHENGAESRVRAKQYRSAEHRVVRR